MVQKPSPERNERQEERDPVATADFASHDQKDEIWKFRALARRLLRVKRSELTEQPKSGGHKKTE